MKIETSIAVDGGAKNFWIGVIREDGWYRVIFPEDIPYLDKKGVYNLISALEEAFGIMKNDLLKTRMEDKQESLE